MSLTSFGTIHPRQAQVWVDSMLRTKTEFNRFRFLYNPARPYWYAFGWKLTSVHKRGHKVQYVILGRTGTVLASFRTMTARRRYMAVTNAIS